VRRGELNGDVIEVFGDLRVGDDVVRWCRMWRWFSTGAGREVARITIEEWARLKP
jgi:hypothetical protein